MGTLLAEILPFGTQGQWCLVVSVSDQADSNVVDTFETKGAAELARVKMMGQMSSGPVSSYLES
jgi:hypothetical protein